LLIRALFLALLLALPFRAQAAQYVVRAGDTLGQIAQRHHMSIDVLARVNGITNINLIQIGRALFVPSLQRTFYYRVRWGDTLLGIAARYHLDVPSIRAMNPALGLYPLAGQWLKLCGPCGSGGATAPSAPVASTAGSGTGSWYVVRPGDTLTGIAGRYGVSLRAIMAANRIVNPDHIVIGSTLTIPQTFLGGGYDPWQARALIVSYAHAFGVDPALPLAIGWQESGFNQNMVSRTGAVGVMQVEPYTGRRVDALLGQQFNLYTIDDNIHVGIYWLASLLSYYGGDQRLAAAAYYQGTRALAEKGMYPDTVQYVNDVLALKASFGG
jgi:LysM repeat protein